MNLCLPANQWSQKRSGKLVRWLSPALVWLAVCMGGGLRVCAQAPTSLEYEVKGAFLVKFGMFVEWPTNAFSLNKGGVFTIGILGDDPFGASYDEAVKKETVRGRSVQIKRARQLAELEGCHILFISASESGRLAELLVELAGKGVLTVADEPGFAAQGGMIGFIKDAGKIRFEINSGAAEKSGLKLSSKLVQVGKRVTETSTAQG